MIFLRFILAACARLLQPASLGAQHKKQERANLGGGALELTTRSRMHYHPARAGNISHRTATSQTFRQWRNRLGHIVQLLLTPAQPPRLELSDSLSHPEKSPAPRARAAARRPRPFSVDRADARALSAYCECVNHTPAVHRCGLTAIATLEQYGGKVRACAYHARRAESFGLVVVPDAPASCYDRAPLGWSPE